MFAGVSSVISTCPDEVSWHTFLEKVFEIKVFLGIEQKFGWCSQNWCIRIMRNVLEIFSEKTELHQIFHRLLAEKIRLDSIKMLYPCPRKRHQLKRLDKINKAINWLEFRAKHFGSCSQNWSLRVHRKIHFYVSRVNNWKALHRFIYFCTLNKNIWTGVLKTDFNFSSGTTWKFVLKKTHLFSWNFRGKTLSELCKIGFQMSKRTF